MSVVEGKRVAFIGSQVPQIVALMRALEAERTIVTSFSCSDVVNNLNLIEHMDLLVINHQQNETFCATILSKLQNSRNTKHMLVISYVDNVEARINRALMLGAADYFTPTDDIDLVLQKVKSNFGMPNTYEGVSGVDITEQFPAHLEKNLKVFVVEDDSLLRSLLSTKFDMCNVSYEFSNDGVAVEEKLRTFKPSVILLDIMIGAVNGLDILESIKKNNDLSATPVVVFSNQDSDDERKRASALGANEYLVKATTDLSDLVKILATLS